MPKIEVKIRQEIAEKYGLHRKTLERKVTRESEWLPARCALTPGYQKLIYETFGWPSGVNAVECESIPLPVVPNEGDEPESS